MNDYDEDDAVCAGCIDDKALRKIVLAKGRRQVCVQCEKENIAVSIQELAALIDPYIREHYRTGSYERRHGLGDDDSHWEEQEGDDLESVVQEVVGQEFKFNDALIDALIDADPADPRDGGEPFYSSDTNYVPTQVHVGHLYDEWRAISNELRTERRFFSDRARKFFDWLFAEIEDLRFYEENGDPSSMPLMRGKKLSVIQEWPRGKVLYRARRADTRDDYTRFVLSPSSELSPPPPKHARAGRMNAEGVSIFYGALDQKTALAEMRASIGGHIVLGRFETTKALHVLDFSRLDGAFSDGNPLSYFQADFKDQITRRKFCRRIHRLISAPVIPGHEDEYLMTQVLAEYLAYVRATNFDGLLFASTQSANGTNIVLFPKHDDVGFGGEHRENLARFPLKNVAKSTEIYQTRGITYDIPKVDFLLDGNTVHVYDDDYDGDAE